jgi:hypothetical protein
VTVACGGVIVCILRRAADRGVAARAPLGELAHISVRLGVVGDCLQCLATVLAVRGVKHKRAPDTGEMASTDPS